MIYWWVKIKMQRDGKTDLSFFEISIIPSSYFYEFFSYHSQNGPDDSPNLPRKLRQIHLSAYAIMAEKYSKSNDASSTNQKAKNEFHGDFLWFLETLRWLNGRSMSIWSESVPCISRAPLTLLLASEALISP